jgi:hypothetical protein
VEKMNTKLTLTVASMLTIALFGCSGRQNTNTGIRSGNGGQHVVTCVPVGDHLLDVDITLKPHIDKGQITYLSGIVTTDAGHLEEHTFAPAFPVSPAETSVQLNLEGVPAGRYLATSNGSGTTTLGGAFTLSPTSCEFEVE